MINVLDQCVIDLMHEPEKTSLLFIGDLSSEQTETYDKLGKRFKYIPVKCHTDTQEFTDYVQKMVLENTIEMFDVIVVDGCHKYESVLKDITNAIVCLAMGGVIIVHDSLPLNSHQASKDYVTGGWCGEVWKALIALRGYPGIVYDTFAVDTGITFIKRSDDWKLETVPDVASMEWDPHNEDIIKLLRIV